MFLFFYSTVLNDIGVTISMLGLPYSKYIIDCFTKITEIHFFQALKTRTSSSRGHYWAWKYSLIVEGLSSA